MTSKPSLIPGSANYETLTATKAQIENLEVTNISGAGINSISKWKGLAICATTVNITLSGLQTIDSTPVAVGDVVLVKNQTDGTENGLYLVASGAWTRSPTLLTYSNASGIAVYVEYGSANANIIWICTNAEETAIVGIDALTFSSTVQNSREYALISGSTDSSFSLTLIADTPVELLGTNSIYMTEPLTYVITIPTNGAFAVSSSGLYQVNFNMNGYSDYPYILDLQLKANSTDLKAYYIYNQAGAGAYYTVSGTFVVTLNTGDYVTLFAKSNVDMLLKSDIYTNFNIIKV